MIQNNIFIHGNS